MLHWRSIMSTKPPVPAGPVVRFGIFEANLSLGELRKNGAKIRLQEQPFQVLAMLLEHPGEIVTREDLRTRLWNAETFVDFDHSLNTAINKLRDALDDSAANPRFVETLAKRGYRFIAPIHSNAHPGQAIIVPNPPLGSPLPSNDLPEVHRAWPRALVALLQIMYLVFYVLALIHWDEVWIAVGRNFGPLRAETISNLVFLTAAVGIPLRLYLLSGVSFDHARLGEKFRRLFPAVLILDLLWACAPFLIVHQIGIGGAIAAMAALLYVPFVERTLIRMAYATGR
jgi:cholera toxin transcriptional activator